MFTRCTPVVGTGWQPMSSAPRDGTIVELVCTYGVAPWYDLFRWTDEVTVTDQDGSVRTFKSEPGWRSATRPGSGVPDEGHLQWRPAPSGSDRYVDPTGGAQNGERYWQQAITAVSGYRFPSR